jgi:hypothetical protein
MKSVKCQISLEKSPTCCSPIKFRVYIGHIGEHSINIAIRNLTKTELASGFGCLARRFWVKMRILDQRSGCETLVAFNIKSIFKRLSLAGIGPHQIQDCLQKQDLSSLPLHLQQEQSLERVSFAVLFSHGPLVI